MKNSRSTADIALTTATLFVCVIMLFIALFLAMNRIAHGAVIDPHLTSPAYITVIAEKGDTAYSIAKLFTPRGQSAMPSAMDFAAFNNLRYNKKGNPVVHARRLYAFPTKMSRDRMRALVLSLNTAPHDWSRELNVSHHPYVLGLKKAQRDGENINELVSGETERQRYHDKTDVLFTLVGLFVFYQILLRAFLDYKKYVAKLDATPVAEEKPPTDTTEQTTPSTAPDKQDQEKGEMSGAEETVALSTAPVAEEKPPTDTTEPTTLPTAPDKQDQEKGEMSGARESRALPLEYRDPKDPYEDPDAPTGLTLGEKIVNVFRAYKMDDVAKALEHDVIPIAALQKGAKFYMDVKFIRLCNIPESVRKHPEWGEQTLHNLITHQEVMLRDIGKNTVPKTEVS